MKSEKSSSCMPDRTRTCNPQLRRLMLYPLSYGHIILSQLSMVGAPRLELGTSCSQSRHATSCAMPRLNGRLIIYDLSRNHQTKFSETLHKKPRANSAMISGSKIETVYQIISYETPQLLETNHLYGFRWRDQPTLTDMHLIPLLKQGLNFERINPDRKDARRTAV